MTSMSMAMTLLEFSAPSLSTKDKNRYNKIVRNQTELGMRRQDNTHAFCDLILTTSLRESGYYQSILQMRKMRTERLSNLFRVP